MGRIEATLTGIDQRVERIEHSLPVQVKEITDIKAEVKDLRSFRNSVAGAITFLVGSVSATATYVVDNWHSIFRGAS